MKITYMTIAFSLIFVSQADAQFTSGDGSEFERTGTSSAVFLKIIPDARSASLGGAHSGIYGDISSLYWNPAGIAGMKDVGLNVAQVDLFAGIAYNFVGIVYPMGAGHSLGFHTIYLNSGEMEETTLSEPEGTGRFFNTASYSLGLTYARHMTDHLMAGITFKYLREDVWLTKAQSFAFDVGTVLETGVLGMRLGMSLTNLGPDMSLRGDNLEINVVSRQDLPGDVTLLPVDIATSAWAIPVTFRVGVAMDLLGAKSPLASSETNRLTLLADFNDSADAASRGNFGLEYNWNEVISLRGGNYFNYDEAGFSYGAGLRYDAEGYDLIFDYAVVDYGRLKMINQFDISFLF